MYLNKNALKVEIMDDSSHWFDTGTHDALIELQTLLNTSVKAWKNHCISR